jgi:hypothetical protein
VENRDPKDGLQFIGRHRDARVKQNLIHISSVTKIRSWATTAACDRINEKLKGTTRGK